MKINAFKRIVFAIALPLFPLQALAQEDLHEFLKENIDDSKVVMGEYISPLMKSISLGLNQGWYNTAKSHKPFGVDLTITVSALTIPKDETVFNVQNLNLQHIALDENSPGYPYAPTIFGSNKEENTPMYYHKDSDETFEGPVGIGLKEELGRNMMPVPIAHLGIGLPKGTDLKIRFVPSQSLGDEGKFDLWGVGVMHDIKQWIPGIKLLPFDLSGFVGYTRMSTTYTVDVTDQSVAGENQRSEFKVNATTVQALISKKFSVLTLYGGFGYNIARSNLAIKGTYDLDESGTAGDQRYETNPLDLKFGASGPRATAGFRLKFAVLTLHADYSIQKYRTISAGIGISVR
jgi:hypothetical protein